MWHPDEGTLHAWIEGQMAADEAVRVSLHVETCDECQKAVAEARGVIAGAARVVGFLDESVGAGTAKGVGKGRELAAGAEGGGKRRWRMATNAWMAIAATVVLAVGSMFVVRGKPGVEKAKQQFERQTTVTAPTAAPITAPTAAPVTAGPRGAGAPSTLHVPQLVRRETLQTRVASQPTDANPPAAKVEAAANGPPPAPAALGGTAGAGSAEIRSAAEGGANVRLNQPRAPSRFAPMQTSLDVMAPASLIGCYQLTPSAESPEVKFALLPRQFALSSASDSVSGPRRAVSRVVDGRVVDIPELTWLARGNGFVVSGGSAGSLIAGVASGTATAFDSTGSQQLRIARRACP